MSRRRRPQRQAQRPPQQYAPPPQYVQQPPQQRQRDGIQRQHGCVYYLFLAAIIVMVGLWCAFSASMMSLGG